MSDDRYNVNRTLPNHSYKSEKPVSAPTKAPDPEKKKRRFGWRKRIALVLFLILLVPFIILFLDLRNASDASKKLFGTGNVGGALVPSLLKSQDGRTNIMLLGYSADDPNHGGALLTDSIMVMSLDKDGKNGYMLSIPRDLLVDIPDYGSAKINEAFQAGEREQAGTGPAVVQKVIKNTFNIDVNYYVIINYGAVRGIVDALGGVTVNIESPDERGLFDPNFRPEEGGPLQLANGPQKIDGQTALRLTRARGSTFGSYGFPVSDFNRAQNQQKVFSAIKQEIDYKLLLDPRTNKQVFDALAANLQTDLQLNEVIPAFRLFKSNGELKPISLRDVDGTNFLTGFQTRSGQSALIPAAGIDDFSAIQDYLRKLEQQ